MWHQELVIEYSDTEKNSSKEGKCTTFVNILQGWGNAKSIYAKFTATLLDKTRLRHISKLENIHGGNFRTKQDTFKLAIVILENRHISMSILVWKASHPSQNAGCSATCQLTRIATTSAISRQNWPRFTLDSIMRRWDNGIDIPATSS